MKRVASSMITLTMAIIMLLPLCPVMTTGAADLYIGSDEAKESVWDPIVYSESDTESIDCASVSSGGFLAPIDPPDPNAIKIYTAQDLDNVRNNLFGSYVLMNDIDLANYNGGEWEPIGGNNASLLTDFSGIFDGQGHVIRNLKITETSMYVGLFGKTNGATIKNVGLEDTNIYIESDSNAIAYIGSICGYSTGSINNCYNTGTIYYYRNSYSWHHAGGICGYNGYSVENCYNMGDVSAISNSPSTAGGICGHSVGAIRNCYNTGDVSSSCVGSASWSSTAGGICGSVYDTDPIVDCFNTGSVSAHSDGVLQGLAYSYAGGIIGSSRTSASNLSNSIRKCYSTGNVTAYAVYRNHIFVGGICGSINYDDNLNTIDCYWNLDSEQAMNGVSLLYNDKKGVGRGSDSTTPLTSDQMRDQSNFIGFDFSTIWDIDPDKNNGYPYLRSFTQDSIIRFKTDKTTYGLGEEVNAEVEVGEFVKSWQIFWMKNGVVTSERATLKTVAPLSGWFLAGTVNDESYDGIALCAYTDAYDMNSIPNDPATGNPVIAYAGFVVGESDGVIQGIIKVPQNGASDLNPNPVLVEWYEVENASLYEITFRRGATEASPYDGSVVLKTTVPKTQLMYGTILVSAQKFVVEKNNKNEYTIMECRREERLSNEEIQIRNRANKRVIKPRFVCT